MLNDLDKRGTIFRAQEIMDTLLMAGAYSLGSIEDLKVESIAAAVAPLVVGAAEGSSATRVVIWGVCFKASIVSKIGVKNELTVQCLTEKFERALEQQVLRCRNQTQPMSVILRQ